MAWIEQGIPVEDLVPFVRKVLTEYGWTVADEWWRYVGEGLPPERHLVMRNPAGTVYLRVSEERTSALLHGHIVHWLVAASRGWDAAAHEGIESTPLARLTAVPEGYSLGLEDMWDEFKARLMRTMPMVVRAQVDAEGMVAHLYALPESLVLPPDPAKPAFRLLYAAPLDPLPGAPGEAADFCLGVAGVGAAVAEPEGGFYGIYTANPEKEAAVRFTRSGALWQAHHLAVLAAPGDMPRCPDGFGTSAWDGEVHASPLYVVHGSEGYRGMLRHLLAADPTGLAYGDELEVQFPDGSTGVYVYLGWQFSDGLRAFLHDSPRPDYGLFLRKE